MAGAYKPCSAAAQRNCEPILEVLRSALRGDETLLEIGSGTGQHAVYFGRQLPGLTWLTSDLPENHDGIRAWLAEAGLGNVHGPIALDVAGADWPVGPVDAVFSANTAHILSKPQVRAMLAGVARRLRPGGPFLLYGPFKRDGTYTSESNRAFDEVLRQADPDRGLRDIAELCTWGAPALRLEREFAMPANNLLLLWRREHNEEN